MSIDVESNDLSGADVALRERLDARRTVLGVGGTVGFLVVWTAVAALYPPYLLPSPVEVALALGGQFEATAALSVPFTTTELALPALLTHLLQSLEHYVPGLLVGCVLGIAAGVAMGWSETLDWIAFAILWVGIGHAGAAFIVAIGAFWINFYNAYAGVEGVSTDLVEVASSLGVRDNLTMIRRVVLPAATPEIFTGVRTSIGQCWMIVVAAELFGAPGVGHQIIVAAQNLSLDVSVAYMLVISAVFLVSDGLFRRVQAEVLDWR